MRLIICLTLLGCTSLIGCATTEQNLREERPIVGPQNPSGHCSSSGSSSQAAGCAAVIALSAALHSVQQ